MQAPSLPPALLLAYVFLGIASLPVTMLVLTLAEFAGSVALSVTYVVGGFFAVTGFMTAVAAAFLGLETVGPLATVVAGSAVCLGVLPVAAGRELDRRLNHRPADEALADALVGLPVGLLAGLLVLTSPDWLGTDYLAAGPAVRALTLGLVIWLPVSSPGILGVALGRLRSNRDSSRS